MGRRRDVEILAADSAEARDASEDLLQDPALADLLHRIASSKMSVSEASRLLDSPASRLSATVRRERRKVAAAVFALAARDLLGNLEQMQSLQRSLLEELARRNPKRMTTPQLLTAIDRLHRALLPFLKAAILDAGADRKADQRPDRSPVAQQTVNLLLQEIHREEPSVVSAEAEEV